MKQVQKVKWCMKQNQVVDLLTSKCLVDTTERASEYHKRSWVLSPLGDFFAEFILLFLATLLSLYN